MHFSSPWRWPHTTCSPGRLALRLIATGQPARISPERLADTARRAGIAVFIAVTAAAFALIWSVFTNDFSITYIMEHSNRALPGAYKFSALWSGQEGSLLLWAWLLGAYGFVLRLTHKTDVKLYAYAGTILAGIQVFFLAILCFAAPPFALCQGAIPDDGNGLNPLLQYPEMVIHPPMLYLGYVGFSVPFCFALGALMMRYPGEKWIKITRVWTMVTWLFLTCGIFLGMHWAYAVLGWGGYWGWDPVENASFMPWLTGTAFLHSVMMQEKKGMMKSWNVWLIFSTFLLTLLGTLLTRAGLVSSVHAFAQSSIGTWFVVFMGIVLAVCIFTYILQRNHLKSEHHLESLVSRESSFLFNNLVLLAACFVILWGTLFPDPVANTWSATRSPSARPCITAWRFPSASSCCSSPAWARCFPGAPHRCAASAATSSFPPSRCGPRSSSASLSAFSPGRTAHSTRATSTRWWPLLSSAAVLTAILSEFLRGARRDLQTDRPAISCRHLSADRRNTRRYGGYIIHIGVVIVVVGLAGAAFNRSVESETGAPRQLTIGPYTLENVGFTRTRTPTTTPNTPARRLQKRQKAVPDDPEKRVYLASQQPQTMVAIHSVPGWDLYVVYEGTNPDTGQPIIKAILNPLVGWIWAGVVLIVFGTFIALVPSLSPATASARPRARTSH